MYISLYLLCVTYKTSYYLLFVYKSRAWILAITCVRFSSECIDLRVPLTAAFAHDWQEPFYGEIDIVRLALGCLYEYVSYLDRCRFGVLAPFKISQIYINSWDITYIYICMYIDISMLSNTYWLEYLWVLFVMITLN